jgi:hypothetical protein
LNINVRELEFTKMSEQKYFPCVRALNINVGELRVHKVSEQRLCLPMAINLGNLGNWNISATEFRPEISLKGITHSVLAPEASLEAVKFDQDCVGSQAVLGRFLPKGGLGHSELALALT